MGFIRPSKVPYDVPVLFQKKHDGSFQSCIDEGAEWSDCQKKVCHYFDNRLIQPTWESPILLQARFTVGYYHVRIVKGDEVNKACVTRYGSYELLVMPFGLTNAPATFCTLMNKIFHPYLDRFLVVYLDDIVVYSKVLEEHVVLLKAVFEKLREQWLCENENMLLCAGGADLCRAKD